MLISHTYHPSVSQPFRLKAIQKKEVKKTDKEKKEPDHINSIYELRELRQDLSFGFKLNHQTKKSTLILQPAKCIILQKDWISKIVLFLFW